MIEIVNGFLTAVETVLNRADKTRDRRRKPNDIWEGLLAIDALLSKWIRAAGGAQQAIRQAPDQHSGGRAIASKVNSNVGYSVLFLATLEPDIDPLSIGHILQVYAPDLAAELNAMIQHRQDILAQYVEFQASAALDAKNPNMRLYRPPYEHPQEYMRRLTRQLQDQAILPLMESDFAILEQSYDRLRKAQVQLRRLIAEHYPFNPGN